MTGSDDLDWRALPEDLPPVPLAVFGFPVRHSLSPRMHNAALAQMAETDSQFHNWRYFRVEVQPEDLSAALAVCHERRILGINLTVPHKVDVLPHIELAGSAGAMGAANTLMWTESGYVGTNTDGVGLLRALAHDLKIDALGNTFLLLGAGGAARGAVIALLEAGARHVYLTNRSLERARGIKALVEEQGWGDRFSLLSGVGTYPEVTAVVNATSLGLKASDPLPLDLNRMEGIPTVYDMIYNPAETPLLQASRARGWQCANGLSMLAFQGVESLQRWTGRAVPQTAFLTALGIG